MLEKKYVIFLIVILLASSFHASAIIGIAFLAIHIFVDRHLLLKYKILLVVSIMGFIIFSNQIMDLIGLP